MSVEAEAPGFDEGLMHANADRLAENPYPGRGIILGNSADGAHAMQAYWVMGRSENSRNRVLVQDGDIVKTEAFDPSQMQDPSLVIYNAMREVSAPDLLFRDRKTRLHIVSNGDQTDTVYQRFGDSRYRNENWDESFRNALLTREFEPDGPNFTPRITGILAVHAAMPPRYGYSLIRRNPATGRPEHAFGMGALKGDYPIGDIPAGAGICFTTYEGDGNPLPSFRGSPFPMPLEATAAETAESLWGILDPDNRVALAVRSISRATGEVATTSIINKLGDEDTPVTGSQ